MVAGFIIYQQFDDDTQTASVDTLANQSQAAAEAIAASDIDRLTADQFPDDEPENPAPDENPVPSFDILEDPRLQVIYDAPPTEQELAYQADLATRRIASSALFPGGYQGTSDPPRQETRTLTSREEELRRITASIDASLQEEGGQGPPPTYDNTRTLELPSLRNEPAEARYLGEPDHVIREGTILHITIESAINTNLAGRIRAFVNRPVYSANGKK